MEIGTAIGGTCLAIGVILIYLFPAITAHQKKHPQAQAITILTVFAGWTAIGWLIALVWTYINYEKK